MADFISNLIFLIVAFLSFVFGYWMLSSPQKIIKLQQKFYLLINWRMEPVSMAKEIRNTKIMGLFLIICDVLSIAYFLFF